MSSFAYGFGDPCLPTRVKVGRATSLRLP